MQQPVMMGMQQPMMMGGGMAMQNMGGVNMQTDYSTGGMMPNPYAYGQQGVQTNLGGQVTQQQQQYAPQQQQQYAPQPQMGQEVRCSGTPGLPPVTCAVSLRILRCPPTRLPFSRSSSSTRAELRYVIIRREREKFYAMSLPFNDALASAARSLSANSTSDTTERPL